MTFIKTLAVGTILASTVAATGAFAKGHNNGFGKGLAGQATAGAVDDGQTNRDGTGPETTYGISDARIEAMNDVKGNSDNAQTRDETHPSSRSDR